MTDFISVDLKLDRATEHLDSFERELGIYVQANPITLVARPQADPLREAFYVGPRDPIPPRLGIVLGDCLHNFRTVLDHVAMALALDNGADVYDSTIQFPICGHPDRFFGEVKPKTGARPGGPPRGTGGYSVRALRPAAQTFVEGLQPYHRVGDSWILTELQALDNMDKHRQLIDHNIEASALFHPPAGIDIEWAPRLQLKAGAYVATVIYPSGYASVKVQPFFTAGICIERSNRIGFMDAIAFTRAQLLPHIQGIVAEAKRLFP